MQLRNPLTKMVIFGALSIAVLLFETFAPQTHSDGRIGGAFLSTAIAFYPAVLLALFLAQRNSHTKHSDAVNFARENLFPVVLSVNSLAISILYCAQGGAKTELLIIYTSLVMVFLSFRILHEIFARIW